MDNLLLFDGSVSAGGVLAPSDITVKWANPATPGNYNSANVIDVSQIASSNLGLPRDIGIGDDPLWFYVVVNTALVGLATSTLQINFQTAPDNGSGSPGTYTTLLSTPALAVGTGGIAAGTELMRMPIPLGVQKFLNIQYVVGTANITSGKIIAGIVLDRPAPGPLMGYPNNYSTQYI
jgi:hypothetical protein